MDYTAVIANNIGMIATAIGSGFLAAAGAFLKVQRDLDRQKEKHDELKDYIKESERPEGKIGKLFLKTDDLYKRSDEKEHQIVALEKFQALQEKDNEFHRKEMSGLQDWLKAIEAKLDRVLQDRNGGQT